MSDTKKPGAPNIKDLKAKLGLKTPGGAAPSGEAPPPPGLVPPPGVPMGGDAFPAPPGIEPPPGVRPPLGVTPPPGIVAPPGIVPPAVTPPPGVAPPSMDLVAPPGFAPPTPAAQPAYAQPVQHVDVDFDVVERKKSRKIVWLAVALGACALAFGIGIMIGDGCLRRDWVAKTKTSVVTTGEVIKKLDQGLKRFEGTLEAEVEKTKKGQNLLAFFNPELFSKISDEADAFDVNNPKLKALLNEEVWMTHYRFVKDPRELLPRLHTLLALCAQIKLAVDMGRAFESQYGEHLKKKTQKYQEEQAKSPAFGIMIRGEKDALFFALGEPVDKDGKKVDKHADALGYMLPNGRPGFFGKQPAKPTECPEVNGSIRMFAVDDVELGNRLKCKGQEDIVFEAWKGHVMGVKLILKELEKVNPRDLYQRFQRAGGGG